MEFCVLGSLRVGSGGRDLPVTGARRRTLLLRLLADAGRVVPASVLVEDLWESSPPTSAAATLQSHVYLLRKVVGPERLRSEGRGYLLDVRGDEFDAALFERDVTEGRSATAAGNVTGAVEALERALSRWRGEAFADVVGDEWARPICAGLEEQRLGALEDLMAARLELGDNSTVAATAEAAVRAYPLRERFWGQLMVALYRSGRQADALSTYQRVRRILGDELGLEPGEELATLEAQILRGELDVRAPDAPGSYPTGRVGELPGGVVTFLMADVVGSTALWDTVPAETEAALGRHDQIMADAVTRNHGTIIKSRGEGDSTFCVFEAASDGLRAALDAQTALNAERWPTPTPIRVRMALHSGEATPVDGDYRSPTVNRAARLRSLASGGQVLLTRAAAELVADRIPRDVKLVELGAYALRDLRRPETVFALDGPSLTVVLVPSSDQVRGDGTTPLPVPARLSALAGDRLVGRTEPLAALLECVEAVFSGHHRVVLVDGEPGIGKTALVAAAALGAHARGATVLYGRSDEEPGVAYRPIAEALGHCIEHAAQGLLAQHVAQHGNVLERLVPALRTRVPATASFPAQDPETERALLPGAVAGLLRAASADRPVVLVLDDLHWADPQTLQVLQRVVTAGLERVLVLATYRTVDPEVGAVFADFLAGLRCEPSARWVSLDGLSADETNELLAAAADAPPGPASAALAVRLRDDTAGNPFFLTELMRHLVEVGALVADDDGWSLTQPTAGLPASVRDVLGRRIRRLGDTVRRVLVAAAVTGSEFDLPTVAAVAGLDEAGALDAIDESIRAGLTRELPGTFDRFGFSHALIRQVLTSDLTTARQRRLHRRVADALELLPGAADHRLPEIAHHRLASAGPAELAEAAALAARAADRALADLAPSDAAGWFSKALDALDASPSPDERRRVAWLAGLGDAQRQAGEPNHRDTLLRAARAALELGERQTLVRAALANHRGWESHVGVVDDDRVSVLRAAIEAIGPGDGVERARLLATLATELQAGAPWDTITSTQDEAVTIARRVGDPATLLYCLTAASTGWVPHTLPVRLARAAEAVALADNLADPRAGFDAAMLHAAALMQAAGLDGFDAALARADVHAHRLGMPVPLWTVSSFTAWRTLLGGDLASAERLAETNLQLGSETGQPDAFAYYGALVMGIRVHEGRLDEFLPMLESLATENSTVAGFRATLAYAHAEAGRLDTARMLLQPIARDNFATIPYDAMWLPALALWAAVAGMTRADDAGAALHRLLTPWRAQLVMTGTGVLGSVEHFLGMAAFAHGALHAAGAHLEAAVRVHDRLRAPFLVANSEAWLGITLLHRGQDTDREHACDLLHRGYVTATERGYTAVARRCATALASVVS